MYATEQYMLFSFIITELHYMWRCWQISWNLADLLMLSFYWAISYLLWRNCIGI